MKRYLCRLLVATLGWVPWMGHATGPSAPKVFLHTRGESTRTPFLEAWSEQGRTYVVGARPGSGYAITADRAREVTLIPPTAPVAGQGVLKRRLDTWWYLHLERSAAKPEDRGSDLYRFQQDTKRWIQVAELEVRAATFEVLDGDEAILFGVSDPGRGPKALAATLHLETGRLSLLEAVPLTREHADWFWEACISSTDDQMACAYFPRPGHLVGFDRGTRKLRIYRTPWTPVTDAQVSKALAQATEAKQPLCIISLTDHPGAAHAYFMPMSPGQMAFVYKVLDEDLSRSMPPKAEGGPNLVERVDAFTFYASDPETIPLSAPSRFELAAWCWSPRAGRLVPLKERIVPASEGSTRKGSARVKPSHP